MKKEESSEYLNTLITKKEHYSVDFFHKERARRRAVEKCQKKMPQMIILGIRSSSVKTDQRTLAHKDNLNTCRNNL